jgi:hypothetical protein
MKKPSIKVGRGIVSKSAKKTGAGKLKRNPVKKLTRYAVRVENLKGQVGYFSGWDNKTGPQFDTDIAKAVKGGDRKLMEHFADAIAERKPRGIASVETVIIGAPVKKN